MSTQNSQQTLYMGHDVTKTAGTRAVPIYQTSSYVFNNSEHASNLFSLNQDLFIPV
jgi:O-acetylhomoserine (thiol)-lyase